MRKSEMEDKRELSQNKENEIQFFWEWFNIKKDKLNEFEPHRHFESLYTHLANLGSEEYIIIGRGAI